MFHFCRVLNKVYEKYKPNVVICQCGADGITGDPMESFNLTPLAFGRCVQLMLSWKLPLMLLGGGKFQLTLTVQFSRRQIDISLIFSQEIGFDISCKLSPQETICMHEMSKPIFWEK